MLVLELSLTEGLGNALGLAIFRWRTIAMP